MRLIDLDAIMAQFPKADFDGDAIENMKAYPYWKIGIAGLINVLKAVPIIEQSEDCISRQQLLEALDTWDKFGYVPQYGLMRISKDDKAYIPYIHYDDAVDCIKALPSVTPTIPDVENNFNLGYNCGYADAMSDIAESEE